MNDRSTLDFQYTDLTPVKSLEEAWVSFNPNNVVDPRSEFYIPRTDPALSKLTFRLRRTQGVTHAFLCGHRGSGKTTELNRLCSDPEILKKYIPIYLTTQNFGSHSVHLTHDAIMVEITRRLLEEGKNHQLPSAYRDEFNNWGKQIVETFISNDRIKGEIGGNFNAWFAYFKAQLTTRRDWKHEEKQLLEPKIQDLVNLLNRIATDFEQKAGKRLLVIIDDLEKGESDAHKKMHDRLFQEYYDVLIQPTLSIIYTLPVYFRGQAGNRISNDELYSFSAVGLYRREDKYRDSPPLCKEDKGYQLMSRFIKNRFESADDFFEENTLDEILRIGGGLFRETSRVVWEAAQNAIIRGSETISLQDVKLVFEQVKKEYQPLIRGEAIEMLKEVLNSNSGWVPGVEPFLQSRAVVEYENGDLWIDLRYVLKPYLKELTSSGK
ncbi:MAG: hypothetical protein COB67_10655 [SAR324 cluster bacterium]|uniref:Uncharacterized protein n=1 Tax=SAR324 cluster bacterium TaxID=2024889 RepID=A0A2A4SXC4_9DELT|nr:MAG: hypothetical protein COB67_10655 [SAR324 cluster bacterium]